MPSIKSRPLCDEVSDTVVFEQMRTSPPRVSRNDAVVSPAFTDDPLITLVPPAASSTDPFTLASEASNSPIGACARAGAHVANTNIGDNNRRKRMGQKWGSWQPYTSPHLRGK